MIFREKKLYIIICDLYVIIFNLCIIRYNNMSLYKIIYKYMQWFFLYTIIYKLYVIILSSFSHIIVYNHIQLYKLYTISFNYF